MGHSLEESWWRLTIDMLSARLLVWVASFGRNVDLTPDAHLFFADRHLQLAALHRARRRIAHARRHQARAKDHLDAAGWDGPPYEAAMALPRPRRLSFANAVSRQRLDDPGDDAA
jgi:hypothetical protein